MKQRPAVSTDIPEASVMSVHSSHELSGCETSSESHTSRSLQNCFTLDLGDWAVATRLLNLNSFFFNFSFSSWSCCNCNACNCNACNCNVSICLSCNRSHSLSSCFFLRCSHSSFSSWNCNASGPFDANSFKRTHSCVSCCTCMWSSSCFVFKLASEVVFWYQQETLKNTQELLPSFQRWVQIFIIWYHVYVLFWGVKNKMPIESNWVDSTSCKHASFFFSASSSSRVIKELARAFTARRIGSSWDPRQHYTSHNIAFCTFCNVSFLTFHCCSVMHTVATNVTNRSSLLPKTLASLKAL